MAVTRRARSVLTRSRRLRHTSGPYTIAGIFAYCEAVESYCLALGAGMLSPDR